MSQELRRSETRRQCGIFHTNCMETKEYSIQFLAVGANCMEFHTSKHIARTISFDQVNQKIYNTSCGRWKNYEKHLGSLTEMFTDYM